MFIETIILLFMFSIPGMSMAVKVNNPCWHFIVFIYKYVTIWMIRLVGIWLRIMYIKSVIYTFVYTWRCFFSIINVYRKSKLVILLWTFNKKENTTFWSKKKMNYVLLHVRSPGGHFPRFWVQRFFIFQIGN